MILLATPGGIRGLDHDGQDLFHVLDDRDFSHLHRCADGRLLAVADETEILALAPGDAPARRDAWTVLGSLPDGRANCLAELAGRLYVGAADARLWVMPADGGEPERVESFDLISSRDTWDTPWGGPPDVRSLAVISGAKPAIYADIHVGGIVRSFDLGKTWTQAPGSLHRDVHRLSTHPLRPDMVLAATAQGCFISHDRGETWDQHLSPFEPRRYQRCVVADGSDPRLILCTASLGPHPRGETGCEGMIFRSEDLGGTWQAAHGGLPDHFQSTIDTHMLAASPTGGGVFAFHDDDHSLWLSDDGARTWREVARLPDVRAVVLANGHARCVT